MLVGLVCLSCVACVPLRLFYPYGVSRGDVTLQQGDDVSSPEIQVAVPIHFYDGYYSSIFVNSNGHLSVESELPSYQPTLVMPIGQDIKMIAAFLSDIDVSLGGNVFYRESAEEAILQRAATDIQSHFSQFPTFEPQSLFIATWDGVASYETAGGELNTFQIVIASDELNSFVIFNYLDGGIQWIKGAGKLAGRLDDPPAQAGFDSGTGRLHLKLPYSGTTRVQSFATESNVNLPGVWMYHIGNTKGGNVQGPDLNTGDVEIFEPEVSSQTCIDGRRTCHQNSKCVDFTEGFCCECLPPFYGNGIQCIEPELPQRLNGKVSGVLNGVRFDALDMHSFVVTKDGRAYTAVSRIPEEISASFMTLNTIGGVIGWMFALRGGPGATNGYEFTGGNFNRTATIKYQSGGEVNIFQTFYGADALSNIRMDTYIEGTAPEMETTEQITVDDYKEEYFKVSPGVIRSRSDRTFRVNNVGRRYTWDQTIAFDECTNDPSRSNRETMRLGVTRNFVIYDPQDRIVRYAMSNKISLMTGFDPCQDGEHECDENAECIPGSEDSDVAYTCECRTGFVGDGTYCADLDECETGLNTCDENAACYNTQGSFQCQCNQGYRGDGSTCTRDFSSLCGTDVCDKFSRCVFNDVEQKPMCECLSGYSNRDGSGCRPIVFACNEADVCDENAACIFNPVKNMHECECVEGFSGDGLYCRRDAIAICAAGEWQCADGGCIQATGYCDGYPDCSDDSDEPFGCNRLPTCNEGLIACRQPDGTTRCEEADVGCAPYPVYDICDRCHPKASCEDDDGFQRCVCPAGYQGDGYRCLPYDCSLAPDMCDGNAECRPIGGGTYDCICNSGYAGNGQTCQPEGCDVLDNCDVNARCIADPRDPRRSMCRCNQGYTGDGSVCIRRVAPCTQVDNCSEFGECVYDPQTLDHRCRCHRGYDGDGMTCTARGLDCLREPRLCDPNASCMLNVDTFMCVCNANYQGDGRTCNAVSDQMNYLLFSRGYSIHKVSYTQNGLEADGSRVLYVPDELAIGVGVDCADQMFYWTDVSNGRISRASQDGFNKEVVVTGFSSPEGVAIDWLSRNIYVTDSGLDIVAVVNINGTYRKTLVSENMVNPRGIILDPQRGIMYWTDWYRDNPTIEMANMDGSDRQVFVETELALPNGLTIDYYTQNICWGDAGMNRIECIRSDGVGRRIITEDAPYPFDVALYGNTIYWSDWTINGVPSIDLNGGEVKDALKLPVGGNGRLYGVAAVGEFCPRVTNACHRSYNGGCRYLCLPTPNGGRTCACPDDIDDVTCAEIGRVVRK